MIRGPKTTFTSTAYATMKGHLLCGEERVTVLLRDDTNQSVDVEILSISQPGRRQKTKNKKKTTSSSSFITKRIIWPFVVGRMQKSFFQQQLDYLEQVAAGREEEEGEEGESPAGEEGRLKNETVEKKRLRQVPGVPNLIGTDIY